jgi:hypothetical protein
VIKTRDNEENVDPDEAAGEWLVIGVKQYHQAYRDRTHAFDVLPNCSRDDCMRIGLSGIPSPRRNDEEAPMECAAFLGGC